MARVDPLKVRLTDLKRITALEGMPDRKLRKLLPLSRKRVLPKNTIVFLEDEPAYHMYFLLSGDVAVTVDQSRSTVYHAQAGQCFGWSAVVAPYLFTTTTQCTEPSVVLEMDGAGLRKLFTRDHRLGHLYMAAVSRIIATRLQDTRRFFTELLSRRNQDEARRAAPVAAEPEAVPVGGTSSVRGRS